MLMLLLLLWLDLCMHISNRLVLVVLLLGVFFAFMFSLFSLLLYVFIDVRLSHLNKYYLLTYLVSKNEIRGQMGRGLYIVGNVTYFSILGPLYTSGQLILQTSNLVC